MVKFARKKGQMAWFCVLIALSVLMNYFGGLLATTYKLPVWLDSAGTVLAERKSAKKFAEVDLHL